ncbi:MAG: VOC family protein [Actinocrinis sp.]
MPDAQLPYAQGTPCWIDSVTGDQKAALTFYHGLFGWTGEANEQFMGYAMQSVGDKPVAGISAPMPGQPPAPPAWTVYFSVGDVNAAADRVAKLGGKVLFGPDEVPETGRMAVAADPAGAMFGLWQAAPFQGFGAAMEPGAPGWFELETPQAKASADFYAALLQVEVPTMPEMPDAYWTISVGGEPRAGIWQNPAGVETMARWNPYILVEDCDATVAKALAAGGAKLSDPKDSTYGRFAKLSDPQGAEFSVITMTAEQQQMQM